MKTRGWTSQGGKAWLDNGRKKFSMIVTPSWGCPRSLGAPRHRGFLAGVSLWEEMAHQVTPKVPPILRLPLGEELRGYPTSANWASSDWVARSNGRHQLLFCSLPPARVPVGKPQQGTTLSCHLLLSTEHVSKQRSDFPTWRGTVYHSPHLFFFFGCSMWDL